MSNEGKPLEGKTILFLVPAFFNYETLIREKMEEMGAIVYQYDERPMTNSLFRALIKIFPSLFKSYSYKYFRRILDSHREEKIDYLFVIKSEMIPISILKEFKVYFKEAKTILYLYDSIYYLKGILNKVGYYDRVLTFDRVDAQNHPHLLFRPLFYADDYVYKKSSENYEYDIAFLGTIHSDRYKILKRLKKQADLYNLKGYWFFYLQATFMFYWYCMIKKDFNLSEKKYFSTRKMSSSQIANVVSETKVIIDIESPGQSGLTMRTIEMLGLKKKLITTNPEIRYYDFYDPHNILVVDRKDPKIDKDFMQTPYKDIPVDIYKKYHLFSWILDVLDVV